MKIYASSGSSISNGKELLFEVMCDYVISTFGISDSTLRNHPKDEWDEVIKDNAKNHIYYQVEEILKEAFSETDESYIEEISEAVWEQTSPSLLIRENFSELNY